MSSTLESFTYILPLRARRPYSDGDLSSYLHWLSSRCEVLVVDGSAPDIFTDHHEAWSAIVRHVPLTPELVTPMGKVGGVLTGLQLATHERIVIADDDVRYDDEGLSRIVSLLADADVVRPQNYFSPMPWHAVLDTGRTLLNRLGDGDWPGTLAVKRSALVRTGGYDGRAMFENLELVRTILAAGGREAVPLDLFIARCPSSARHFFSQRIRQAYDEFARPARLVAQLAILPFAVVACAAIGWRALLIGGGGIIVAALLGRWRGRGATVFPVTAAIAAPVWVAERAICSWLAVIVRITLGGVPYGGGILTHAATPMRELRARHAAATTPHRSA